jgi:putative addiction module component (TIGR02574 family)
MINREQILEQALALPVEDRFFVVAALTESLPASNPAGTESASELLKELRRRSAAFRAGATSVKSAAEVLDEQRRKQEQEAGT